MSHSFATTANLNCPHCRQPFTNELWLIVDVDERPDLAARIRDGTLHEIACPHCATNHSVSAPLLVLRATKEPPLIFVPVDGASSQQNQQTVNQLVALLRQNMGRAWQESWLDKSDTVQWNSNAKTPAPRTDNHATAGTQSPSPSLQAILQELSQPARITDMPRRVQLCEAALIQIERTQNPPLWAALQNELGNSLAQNPQGPRAENLERAISGYEQALQVRTRQAMPVEWATTTMNLANAYYSRIRGERAENLERAISGYEQALQVMTRQAMPVEWAEATMNLANAYYSRIRGERAENLERAIALYQQALEVQTLATVPADHRKTQRNLADLYFSSQRWGESVLALRGALAASELLYQLARTPEARQAELTEIRQLPGRLAYALAKQGLSGDISEAVVTLEQNRARWLREGLALRSDKPAGVADLLWQRFVTLGQQIQDLQAESRLPSRLPEDTPAKRPYLVLSALLRTAYTELTETVTRIRAVAPGFMPQPHIDEIQAAAHGGPLVYLLSTSAGSFALLVTATRIQPIWLDFTQEQLVALLNEGYISGQMGNPDQLKNSLNSILPLLGEKIMQPIATALRTAAITAAKQTVTLIPTGYWGLLPLHAAMYVEVAGGAGGASPTNGIIFGDEFPVRYAPSARALTAAQERPITATTPLVAVGNPTGADNTPALFTDWLANEVSQLLQATPPLLHTNASGQALRTALTHRRPHHLLFGCHGSFNPIQPLDSGLALADGQLTLRAFLGELRLDGCDLVTLCACQTALTDFNNLPDETIGLPAALLQAGARQVVATLWSVHALPTVLLLRHFYIQIARGVDTVESLSTAVGWLRTRSRAEVEGYLERFKPYTDQSTLNGLRLWLATEGERPFSSPLYWAAFTYTQ